MLDQHLSGNQIRQQFIDFFKEKGHTHVPSSSLVPGGDQTLLFTNSGMVQFKDVFLGTDKRSYTRAANSQKCMRVAGKHNDLEDVGLDDTHHTFFEMLGNWSFGDYYKEEAIAWAWELFTKVWDLPKDRIWATCFEDELGEIPRDDEAADIWRRQPGFDPAHVEFFGRADNFWEMAETGPCGPNSEIHLDQGIAYCDKQGVPGHECHVNGDCPRFLELWNLVFIQYNRKDASHLELLPKKHVDTGLGFERIVAVLQGVDSNYKTDLLSPLLDIVQELAHHTDEERELNLTPYRVIADHARAAAFLIADGVVPGNTGRNYICRMIIRRAARFGGKIGFHEPFLAHISDVVIKNYGAAYPELVKNHDTIMENITREEERFQQTLESGVVTLERLLDQIKASDQDTLPGEKAFNLYATYGLPLEISRDIAREQGLEVDQSGFDRALEAHRTASTVDQWFYDPAGQDVEVYQQALSELQNVGTLGPEGVKYNPYQEIEVEAPVLVMFKDGEPVRRATTGDKIEVLMPKTGFYLESGGQVSDTGSIVSVAEPRWEIKIIGMRQPTAGVTIHVGEVLRGEPQVGEIAISRVDLNRRLDIMRNHTATHLLHAELHAVLGDHARQAGSLVAPDRLRFDFTHPVPVTAEQLESIETNVNQTILANHTVQVAFKPYQDAIQEGVIALFGEKYGDIVRTVSIGSPEAFSYELCGGTHLEQTADIGVFLITSETSAAAGIRRIEAVTGRGAYQLIRTRFSELSHAAAVLNTSPTEVVSRTQSLVDDLDTQRRQIQQLKKELATASFTAYLEDVSTIHEIPVLAATLPEADADTLRQMTDLFRQKYPSGVVVLASVESERPFVVAAITPDLVSRGLHAGELVKAVAKPLDGGGGGRPSLAQAGGKDAHKLPEALATVSTWVEKKLQSG